MAFAVVALDEGVSAANAAPALPSAATALADKRGWQTTITESCGSLACV